MAFVSSFAGAALAPTRTLRVSRSVAPVAVPKRAAARMSIAPPAEATAALADASQLLAAKVGDFGGYIGPILGILTIGVIIAVLTPPIKE